MAAISQSPLLYLQRLGIMEPVAANPERRICFDTLLVNTKPTLADEALPSDVLKAERSPYTSDRQTARVFKLIGSVVVETV
jgi:hypothetical protein